MKIVTANGKKKIVMNRKEWEEIGKKAGWNDSLGESKNYSFDSSIRTNDSATSQIVNAFLKIARQSKHPVLIRYDAASRCLYPVPQSYEKQRHIVWRVGDSAQKLKEIVSRMIRDNSIDMDKMMQDVAKYNAYTGFGIPMLGVGD